MIDCINGCGQMSQLAYEGVDIDICKTCAGVWLDFGELTTIVETKERTWPESIVNKVLSSTGALGISAEERNRILRCPKCNAVLPPTNYQGNSGIIVNACQKDHGLWLDSGELAKIQIYMEKWQAIAKEDDPKYQSMRKELEKNYKDPAESRVDTGPSGSQAINRYINKIIQLIG
jgi:Zn-finger nucleic acid-binding protein